MSISPLNPFQKYCCLLLGITGLALVPIKALAADETKASAFTAPAQGKPEAVLQGNYSAGELRALLIRASQLHASGQKQAAYELLLLNEFEGAGNVDFDYLLGVTAIDSGHPDQAIFVLLRVLNQKSKHSGARLELGRAYYANGDMLDAQAQFEQIMQQNPPDAARSLSRQYLAAIERQLAASTSKLVRYIDLKTGFTTNANGATANQQPFRGLAGVPAGVQDLALDSNSLEQSSSLLAVSGGLNYSEQFEPRWFAKAGGQVNGQVNPSAHFVDTHGVSAYASVEKRVVESYIGFGVDLAKNYVDHQFSASAIGLNVIAGNKISGLWSGLVQLRAAGSNYNDTQSAKDSRDYTMAFTASRAPVGPKQLQFSAGLIGQRISAESDVNSKDVTGLSTGIVMVPWPLTSLSVSAAYVQANFDAPVLGTAERSDKTIILGVGVARPSNVHPNLRWSMRLDANETRSSLDLFDADALKLTVGARYDFQ
jgi:tetratricopeptide (TPR) repeat protein